MEKCLLGRMVHLAFRIDTPCTRNKSGFEGSPVVLRNVIHLPTKASRTPGLQRKSRIPELLASFVIKSKSQHGMRIVNDVFMEFINCVQKSTYMDDDKHVLCLNTEDTVGECPVKDTSNEVTSEESTCSNAKEVESPWDAIEGNTGINLILSAMSNDDGEDDGSNDNILVMSDPLLEEGAAKEDRKTVTDCPGERLFKNCYKVGGKSLGFSSNFGKNVHLSHLQQSFHCASDSNVFQMRTGITVTNADKYVSPGVASTTLINQITFQPRRTELKRISCSTNKFYSDSSFLYGLYQSQTNSSVSRILLDEKIPNNIDNLQTKFLSSDNCVDTFHSDITCCSVEIFKQNSILTNVLDHSFDFEIDSIFDSPSSEDLDTFLAHFNLSCCTSKTGQDGKKVKLSSEEDMTCLRSNKTDKVSSVPSADGGNHLLRTNRPKDFKTCETRSHHSSLGISSADAVQKSKHSLRSKSVWDARKSSAIERPICDSKYSDTPEIYSSVNIPRSQSYLSSTPISQFENDSRSSFTFRKTKHLSSSLRGDYHLRKKKSKTLWKYITSMEKQLIQCSEIPSIKHATFAFDEEREKLEVSSILCSENSSDKRLSSDQDNMSISLVQNGPTETVTDESLLSRSEVKPVFPKEELTISKTVPEPLSFNSCSPAATSAFTGDGGDNRNFVHPSFDKKHEKQNQFIKRAVKVMAGCKSPLNHVRSKSSDLVKTLKEQLTDSSCGSPLLFSQSHS